MSPRVGVVTFPGTLDDNDAVRGLARSGIEPVPLWHADPGPTDVDAVILPGGASHGHYLRWGALARHAPIMDSVLDSAGRGMPVLGIGNGFQILCEAGLLPGALTRNTTLRFVCRDQWLRVENTATPWTTRYDSGAEIVVPVKTEAGCYVADPETVAELDRSGRVVFRYVDENPTGSRHDIAGISSPEGRVLGVLPHPEHAIDALTGPSDDGLGVFYSLFDAVRSASHPTS